MFNSRGFRLSALLVSLIMAFSVVAVDQADARRGGSFGSRGLRTFQSAPATPTAPNATAPINRTMTPGAPSANRVATPNTTRPRPSLFGGFGGALLGGLLFSGLFGMLFGYGFGGLGGMLALLAQIAVVGAIAWFFLRRRQSQPAMAGGPGNAYRYDAGTAGGYGSAGATAANRSAASRRAGKRDEIGVTDKDLDLFQQRLEQLQDAYSREDYGALRRITTPEMMSYLAEELGANATKGLRNEVFDVRLVSGDVAEAWREGGEDYATASLAYESRDITRERSTGKIVDGEDNVTPTTELWTFVRRSGGPWLVSAIQET